MNENTVKRNPPKNPRTTEYRCKCDACKSARNNEHLRVEYRRSNSPHPLRYAHPIFTVSGRAW